MTYWLKLIFVNFWALPRAAGAEDVDLHQFVADDVQTDEEHAVLDQFGPHDLGDLQVLVGHFRRRQPAAGVDVAAHVVAAAGTPKGGVLALVPAAADRSSQTTACRLPRRRAGTLAR